MTVLSVEFRIKGSVFTPNVRLHRRHACAECREMIIGKVVLQHDTYNSDTAYPLHNHCAVATIERLKVN